MPDSALQQRLLADLEQFAVPRHAHWDSLGLLGVRSALRERLAALGPLEEHHFGGGSGNDSGTNLILRLPGREPQRRPLLVGAHYDGPLQSPGARDTPCPWCAVEQRIGQPICRFPNTVDPAPATAAASRSSHWDKLDQTLAAAFCSHHQRALGLLAGQETTAQHLLEHNHELQSLLNGHGDVGQWLDQAQMQRQLNSWLTRLRGWFADPGSGAIRRRAADQLQRLAQANSELVKNQVRQLHGQRNDLQRQLSALDLSPLLALTASDDPQRVAEPRLHEAIVDGHERWLREQLRRELLRSWKIEGFGEARLRLLESHGLCNGDQLRSNIDRLQALPGIGAGLHRRLRTRLDQVVQQLETRGGAAIAPGPDDLMLLPELLALQSGEQQLLAINRSMVLFVAAVEALQTTIRTRRSAMTIHLKAFEALC